MKKSRINLITQLLLTTVFSTTVAQQAFAVDFNSVTSGVPLGSVTSGSSTDYASDPSSAPNQAPSQASLSTYEPQSVVSKKYIDNYFTGNASYSDVMALTPGVTSAPINGYGNDNAQFTTIHGFQDGQYNVLFDGIPFADGQDQTHHANQYMMAADMGSLVVDRGPGRADTVGLATFGGTVFVNSKDPLQNPGITTRLQYGSFNTKLYGAELDTGDLKNYGDTRAFIDFNRSQTDGAYPLNSITRTNLFGKIIKPINDNNTVTVVGMVNDTFQHISPGGTPQQLAVNPNGITTGLNSDPTSNAYFGYNHDQFKSYLYYIQLQSQYGRWSFDNKLFTTEYAHTNEAGTNVNGNTNINGLASATFNTSYTPGVNDVGGSYSLTQNINYGDVFRGKYSFGRDDLGMGIWVNRQVEQTYQQAADLTSSLQYGSNGLTYNAYNTIQPYVEYTWRPIENLEVTPGVKYDALTEDQSALNTNYASTSYHVLLPSLDIHYNLKKNWSVYAQAAEGFLPPKINRIFSTSSTNNLTIANTLSPENTKNLQVGTVYKTNRYSFSGDAYFINNNNLVQSVGTNASGFSIYQSAGNANFSGIDTEATYKIGYGYSLYGNFTYERTQSATPIIAAPSVTSALGLMYEKQAFNSSLIAKEVGRRYVGVDQNSQNYYLGSYTLINFAAGYHFTHMAGYAQESTVQFQINNLTNRYDAVALQGNTTNGNPLLYTLFGRTFNVNLTTTF